MQKINIVDSPYSAATCNSQPLTFIDSDFVGVENTQATEFNYDLTFPNEQNHYQASQQQQQSQLGTGVSQFDYNNDSSQVIIIILNILYRFDLIIFAKI